MGIESSQINMAEDSLSDTESIESVIIEPSYRLPSGIDSAAAKRYYIAIIRAFWLSPRALWVHF